MTDVVTLARRRAKHLAHLESLDGWASSNDKIERRLYAKAKLAFAKADARYQEAVADWSEEDLFALTPPLHKHAEASA